MARMIEPGNLVFEPRYEEHGETAVGRTVLYTPEGEYLLDVEMANAGPDTRFSLVMDAGVVDDGGFTDVLESSEVSDEIVLTEQTPSESYLGEPSDPEFYRENSEPGLRFRCYSLEDDKWNVNLENPVDAEFPARLRVEGVASDVEEVKEVFSRYADRISRHSLSHSSRYSDSGYVLDESEITSWSREDWSGIMEEALENTVEVTPELKDRRQADD